MRSIVKVAIVKAPDVSNSSKYMLQDITTLTRGIVISQEMELELTK